MIRYLFWDSKFFQKKIGKIFFTPRYNLKDLKMDFRDFMQKKYDCLYLEIPQTKKSLLKFCQEKKISLIEKRIILEKEVKPTISFPKGIEEKISSELFSAWEKLAGEISLVSRFSKDYHFQKKARQLYEIWIYKSLFKKYAQKYFLAVKNQSLVGLITLKLKNNHPYIDLFVVRKKMQGKGWGKKLLQAAFFWAQKRNYRKVFVLTQAENEKAVNFYLKNGFQPQKISYFFHLWRKE